MPAEAPPSLQPGDLVKAQLLDADDMRRTLDRLARQVVEHLAEDAPEAGRLALIGMQTRGVFLAQRLRRRIEAYEGVRLPFGTLDATFYRDDVRLGPAAPVTSPTDIPFDVTGRRIVLVDDVIYTGRSVRAALDALLDLGRPASVQFLALIDRGLRELPVVADFVGREVPTASRERVRVRMTEQDGMDGVWLVEKQVQGSGVRVQG